MHSPNALIQIIETAIRKQTANWIGPQMAKGIAEDIVSQICIEDIDLDRMDTVARLVGGALIRNPDDAVLKSAEYAVRVAEMVIRERDEYVLALDKICAAQKSGKPFEAYEIARNALENNRAW